MSAPLLVVAHEATRSGSVVVLEALLRHAAASLPVPLAVQVETRGPMEGALLALADPGVAAERPAAVLVNSAVAAGVALRFADDVPVAVYVHEDEEGLARLDDDAREALAERCARVLCVSSQAAEGVRDRGVPPDRIVVVPPLLSSPDPPTTDEVRAARAELEAPPGTPVVMGCGEAAWHKGPDLFVEMARALPGSVRAAWIGRRGRSLARVLDYDVATTRGPGSMLWLGEVSRSAPLLAAADVLVVTSRRDAQPLVPLEAALVGTPTASFAVGGLVGLGHAGAVATVPYPDTTALRSRVESLLDDPEQGRALVHRAREVVRTERSPEAVVPLFVAEIDRLVRSGRPT